MSKRKMIAKEDLQAKLISEKNQIRSLIAQLKNQPKEIKLFANLYGEYKVTTRGRKLLPEGQEDSEVWHYDIALKTEEITVNKKRWATPVANKLIDDIHDNIDNTFWYFGDVSK